MTADSPASPFEEIRNDSFRLNVVRASGSKAGVLLYPTIFGLTEAIRALATELAQAGLTAVVWDPYNGDDSGTDVADFLAKSKRCEDRRVVADLKLVVDYMCDDLGLSAIGGIGWCFGGRLGLLHAGSDDRVETLCAYNPTIWPEQPITADGATIKRSDFPEQTMDEFAMASSVRGPVQICRPENDFTPPGEYEKLIAALYRRPDPTVYEYFPEAEHAFSYKPGEANQRAHRFAWAASLSLFSTSLLAADSSNADGVTA